jgi:multicomponent Na+:H+ antiporter subunit C
VETALAFVVGGLVAASLYLMLQRHLVKFVLGLVLINHAVNLLIFTSGRLTRGRPPLIAEQLSVPAEPIANALPQALILTAIVIGFSLLAFVLVLAQRAFEELGTIDTEEMRAAEQRPEEAEAGQPVGQREAA